jgi:UDP-N-acetylmuramate: L-alanyl-gamma-D-glutamyl-meso-diaminopimelate ligase
MVVAGTHGKTTTTSMLAWVLENAGRQPGFLIGGLPVDLEMPFRVGQGDAFVIEGDEYDSAFFDKGPKFMHYRPRTALLGAVEFDHADIYPDLAAVKTAFARLVNLIPRSGLLVCDFESSVSRELAAAAHCRVEGYGFSRGSWRAVDYDESDRGGRFRVLREGRRFTELRLQVSGEHNALNALAVVAAAADRGLSAEEIRRGLESFRGVRRRLEERGRPGGVLIFDDFAHHPTAVAHVLRALRRRFAGRRIWAVLEPRSWSMRKNVFQGRLAEALVDADRVVLASVYREGSVPEAERLDVDRIVADLARAGREGKHLPDGEAIVKHVLEHARVGDVVVVMSNGGFDGLIDRLTTALEARGVRAS